MTTVFGTIASAYLAGFAFVKGWAVFRSFLR